MGAAITRDRLHVRGQQIWVQGPPKWYLNSTPWHENSSWSVLPASSDQVLLWRPSTTLCHSGLTAPIIPSSDAIKHALKVHPVSLGGWTEWHLSHSGCSTHLAKAKPWNHQLSSQYPLSHLERKMLWLGLLHVDICSEIKTTNVIYENRMSSQVVILFLSFGGIFSSPGTELIEWTIKPDLSIKCMILGMSAKTRKQGPSRMSRMLSTQSWDYTKGRAAMLGEAGGGALPTHTHSCLLPNFLSQELRTNQSKVATGPHRAHSLIHSLSLAPCLPQGFLPLVTEDWGWDWEGSQVLATPCPLYAG